jgi:hypothetical protein
VSLKDRNNNQGLKNLGEDVHVSLYSQNMMLKGMACLDVVACKRNENENHD